MHILNAQLIVDLTCNAGEMALFIELFPLIILILPMESYLHALA